MNRLAFFSLALACLLASSAALAQQMGVVYEHRAATNLGAPAGLDVPDGQVDGLIVRGGWPIQLGGEKPRWVLIPGVAFSRHRLSFAGDAVKSRTAYGIGASFIAYHRLTEGWGLVGRLALDHQSDLVDTDRRAWMGSMTTLVQRRFRRGHRLGFGAALTISETQVLPLPVLDWRWRNDDWRIEAVVPQRLRAGWRISERLDVGPELRLDGRPVALTAVDAFVRSVTVTAGASARYQVAGPLYASGFVGMSVFNRLEIDHPKANFDPWSPDNALSVRFGLVVVP